MTAQRSGMVLLFIVHTEGKQKYRQYRLKAVMTSDDVIRSVSTYETRRWRASRAGGATPPARDQIRVRYGPEYCARCIYY